MPGRVDNRGAAVLRRAPRNADQVGHLLLVIHLGNVLSMCALLLGEVSTYCEN